MHRAFCLLVVALFAGIVGAVMGFEYRGKLEKDKPQPLVPRPIVQNPPPYLIPCTKEGRIEHDRVCRARWRSTRIGEKQ